MERSTVFRSLMALAQTARLSVVRTLVVAGLEGMTPSALTEVLGVPATNISFHLKELVNTGLISKERQGTHLVYRSSFGQMNALLTYLTENCCQGQGCLAEAQGEDSCAC